MSPIMPLKILIVEHMTEKIISSWSYCSIINKIGKQSRTERGKTNLLLKKT